MFKISSIHEQHRWYIEKVKRNIRSNIIICILEKPVITQNLEASETVHLFNAYTSLFKSLLLSKDKISLKASLAKPTNLYLGQASPKSCLLLCSLDITIFSPQFVVNDL